MSSLDTLTRRSQDELRRRVKVVVIDDDANGFPTKELQAEGYTIEYWEAVKSLERLERGDFDIIVLDIAGVAGHLCEDDGLGVIERIKQVNPYQIVVALSGQTYDLRKQRFFKLADDHIGKPAEVIRCMTVLDDLIGEKLTVEHLWASVEAILRHEGVPNRKIQKLQDRVVKDIKDGRKPNGLKTLAEWTDRAEVVVQIGTYYREWLIFSTRVSNAGSTTRPVPTAYYFDFAGTTRGRRDSAARRL